MNTLTDIIRFLRSLTSPQPLRDWLIILLTSATLMVLLLAGATYLFFGVQSGSIIGDTSSDLPSAPRVLRSELADAVERYEDRRINFEAGSFSVPDVSDPS